jgi:type I restriction-modification system DNA methylase subunit
MLAPYKGRIYDPACGSGGMFVQSEKFVESHGGKLGDISISGQESNATTRRLAIMNLAIRGIEADIGKEHADTFRNVQHPDLRADYVLANPPFNDSDTALRGSAFLESEATAGRERSEGQFPQGRRRALAVRRPAQGQRQLRLGAALHPPPRRLTS